MQAVQSALFWRVSSAAAFDQFLCSSRMTSAADVAGALNRWARQDLDMLGGTDGHALESLLNDYFFCLEDPHCRILPHPV